MTSGVIKNGDDISTWLSGDVQDEVKELSYRVFDGVVSRTPVKFGQLRQSRNLTKNEQDFTTVDVGIELPPPERPVLHFNRNEYPMVFLSNGKPYAPLMEDGGSKQAPHGVKNSVFATIAIFIPFSFV